MASEHDVFPLGVSGLVTVPRSRVETGRTSCSWSASSFLFSDEEREAWLERRLDPQLDSPLIGPGSGAIARNILDRLPIDPRPQFARKLLQTLRDGEMHSTVAVSTEDIPVAVCFVCWRGGWQDLIAKRYGQYLPGLFGWIGRLNAAGLPITTFLQIDAFIEETVDPGDPMRDLEDAIVLDVEYSYLPGHIFRSQSPDGAAPNLILMNVDLMSEEQKSELAPLLRR